MNSERENIPERTRVLTGERVGRLGKLRLGCAVAIFDGSGSLLLTQRQDNGQWCLPSGGMEPGESAAEAAERETRKETGLEVRVTTLVGVYSSPDFLIKYPDGNHFKIVSLLFLAEVVGGRLGLSDETTAYGFFDQRGALELDVIETHQQRVADAFAFSGVPFLR